MELFYKDLIYLSIYLFCFNYFNFLLFIYFRECARTGERRRVRGRETSRLPECGARRGAPAQNADVTTGAGAKSRMLLGWRCPGAPDGWGFQ